MAKTFAPNHCAHVWKFWVRQFDRCIAKGDAHGAALTSRLCHLYARSSRMEA